MILLSKKNCLRVPGLVLFIGLLMAFSQSVLAQQSGPLSNGSDAAPSVSPLQQDIVEFSERLSDGLGLSVRSGLFNTRAGEVKGTYLLHQGIVLELVTPLGATRPGLSLASVNASLQQLSGQLAGLAESRSFARSNEESTAGSTAGSIAGDSAADAVAAADTASFSFSREEAAAFFRDMNSRITRLAFFQDVDIAMRNAAESARSLYSSGHVNSAAFTQMNSELHQIREDLAERLQELSALQAEVQRSSIQAANSQANAVADASAAVTAQNIPTREVREQWQARLAQLIAGIEPLKQAALAKADQIQNQVDEAREAQNLQWQQELLAFETQLFTLVCQDQQLLAVLPDQQHLTMIMPGLGVELNVGVRSSRIHVLTREDIDRCQSGSISPAQLTERANTYNY